MAMRVALSLIVLSALLAILAVAVEVTEAAQTGTNTAAEMKQLTLADVNQATEQQDQQEQKHQEMPAVRLVRQLGAARRFGRFGGEDRLVALVAARSVEVADGYLVAEADVNSLNEGSFSTVEASDSVNVPVQVSFHHNLLAFLAK